MILIIGHFYIGFYLCKAGVHGLDHKEISDQFCIIPCLFTYISINFDFRTCRFDVQFVFGIDLLRQSVCTQNRQKSKENVFIKRF